MQERPVGRGEAPRFTGRGLRRALAPLALLLVVGCQRDEITHFKVPKGGQAPAGNPGVARAAMPGQAAPGGAMAGDVPPPPVPTGGGALKWTLPKGWSDAGGGGGMRYATLKPATPGKIDVSVTVLPGPAGGELANVNRWRGQIGLPPLEEAALAGARKSLSSKAGPVSVYDFTAGEQAKTRLVAGLASRDGNTWFVKMVGDAGPVGVARPEFIRLLESLRFDANP
jgi:hypothetical protein